MPISSKKIDSNTSAMDEMCYRHDCCCLPLLLVFCTYSTYFSSFSINWVEKKTDTDLLFCLLFGLTVSCCSSNIWYILLRHQRLPKGSTQRSLRYQYFFAKLSCNESLLRTLKKTKAEFFL